MASFIVYGDASGQVTVAAPAVAGSNTITFPAETGTLVTSASTTMPNTIVWDTTIRTSSFTAAIDSGNFCNTTGGAFTVTLPATPTRGDFVVIVDYAGTSASNNITVNPNGGKINGGGNAILATNRQGITFTYIDSTQGWLASSNVYGGATPFNQTYTASYLVVAGGGGGGSGANGAGGGGGAGGYLTGTATLTSGVSYTITVGGGGTGGTAASPYFSTSGSNSLISGSGLTTITGTGGGFGSYGGPAPSFGGANGGSGGASGTGSSVGGSGTPGQGNNGGNGFTGGSGIGSGGGGGGASAAGGNGTPSVGAAGGAGTASSITGSPATYAGGGGGGARGGTGALGGPGTPGISGGNGANGTPASLNGSAGVANTGGGGGAGGYSDSGGIVGAGGGGGNGVVILSIPTANYSGTTTGSPTVTTSGGNTILRYTASGTYTA